MACHGRKTKKHRNGFVETESTLLQKEMEWIVKGDGTIFNCTMFSKYKGQWPVCRKTDSGRRHLHFCPHENISVSSTEQKSNDNENLGTELNII